VNNEIMRKYEMGFIKAKLNATRKANTKVKYEAQ